MKQPQSLCNHHQCSWCEGPIRLGPTWPSGLGAWSRAKALAKPGSYCTLKGSGVGYFQVGTGSLAWTEPVPQGPVKIIEALASRPGT